MTSTYPEALFESARTFSGWTSRPVPRALLEQVYERARWGPTSMNLQPMRLVFLTTPGQRERLVPALKPANVAKVLAAPVTALVAWEVAYYERLPQLYPQRPQYLEQYRADAQFAERTALRNSSLQGAYFMLAARSLGLDCGPMSGFDEQVVDRTFFADGPHRINFICNLVSATRRRCVPAGRGWTSRRPAPFSDAPRSCFTSPRSSASRHNHPVTNSMKNVPLWPSRPPQVFQ